MRKREDEVRRRKRRSRRKRRRMRWNEGEWEGKMEDKESERGIREGRGGSEERNKEGKQG